jgi:adenosylcobinamide kinase/adenosylcobinamide-phosphate guanylyltransferase
MIYFITGGERSGKSRHAQKLALELSEKPLYIATSRISDEDFAKRVKRHKKERDERWKSVEEEKLLSKLDLTKRVAVIDCVTLWLTNFWIDTKYDVSETLKQAKKEFDKLVLIDCTLIIISNEIGMGLHGANEKGRKFVELQGWINQYIAQKADNVTFMVSGIPVQIKNEKA